MLWTSTRLAFSGVQRRTFASTPTRSYDLAKLVLVGRLGKDPELRTTKNDKEYISLVLLSLTRSPLILPRYSVATSNFPPAPPNPDGTRVENGVTWHHIVSFNPTQNNYLRTLSKGSRVYVEANYELRDPDPNADSSSPSGQRQIFLRHEALRVLSTPYQQDTEMSSDQV
ncbi:hypothetical protein JVT61DRAFT_12671 [Boletus reticuloceps]|uniref:Single-stranded DNA-binding protein n=1 Tax=Boletus reticuloceps TaxID=495285 RepID=A0A8I2YU45_9AGAM|nr:hypothetical protein JVT61DRAFT_12671 [Boletus reticuloceps]